MAKMAAHRAELIEAIRAMGIEPNDTRKVIIEIDVSGPVIVHVQQLADERLLGVVKALDGDMRIERGEVPAEVAE